MSEQIDETARLIREMQEGSSAAFDAFYERYAPFVFRLALKMNLERMEAEDVCHDVFLEVYRTAGQYNSARGSVEAWLAVRTRSRCLDRIRRSQRIQFEEIHETHLQHGENLTEQKALGHLEREVLQEALGKIPAPQQEAVYGVYYESLTQRELAEKTAKPLGTVKSLLRYGLANLRKQLVQLGWTGPAGGGNERD